MVRVKICGLTSVEDAEMVCEAGPDFVGVVVRVDVSTPREVDPEEAAEILDSVPSDIGSVAVTMVDNLKEIKNLEEKIEPDFFQIHSELSQSQILRIRGEIRGKIIAVASVPENPGNPEEIISTAEERGKRTDLLLLDTKGSGGGTGRVHDWELSSKISDSLDVPLILAGGLTSFNVREAIERIDPYAVDVSSGVESEAGEKDPELVGKFIERARD